MTNSVTLRDQKMVHARAMGKARTWTAVLGVALVAIGFVVGLSVGSARPRTSRESEPATAAMIADSVGADAYNAGPLTAQRAAAFLMARATTQVVFDANVRPNLLRRKPA